MKTVPDIPLRLTLTATRAFSGCRRQRNHLVLTQPEGQLSAACPTQELLDESQVRGHDGNSIDTSEAAPNGLPASTPT